MAAPSPHDETRSLPVEATSQPAVSTALPASIPVSESDTADTGAPLSVTRTASLPEGREDEITIRGVKDAWVEVRGPDGSRLFYDHVRAGEMRAVRSAGPWRIYLSDADAVEVSLGAHIVDVPASNRAGSEARFGLRANGSVL